MTRKPGCVFCPVPGERTRGRLIGRPVWEHVTSRVSQFGSTLTPGVVYGVFEPLNPVVPGHLLVVPDVHVEHAKADATIAAGAMDIAGLVAARYRSSNIITSIGPEATQSVKHLHLHVVPRHKDDGLTLPWTGQKP